MGYRSLRRQTLHYFARPHERVLREPLESPAAWRGDAMRRRSDWVVRLADDEVAELRAAVRVAQACGRPAASLRAADFPLPTLGARLAAWRREVRHGRGFVLVRGVPVGEWTEEQAGIFFWCFGLHFGIPGAQNPQGDLLGHVRDLRTGGDERYYRTNRDIAVHCDAADVVGLLCLRAARSGGLSRIASSVSVYNELLRQRPDLVDRLYRPMYFDTHGDGGVRAFPIAPCAYAAGELRTFWQSDYYRTASRHPHVPALTRAERELLDTYDGIAASPEFHLDMDLQPGDLQLLSNHTQLHARTAFEDWPEPERRRHLLRLWMSLPEPLSWRLRWMKARAHARLAGTAVRELVRDKLAA